MSAIYALRLPLTSSVKKRTRRSIDRILVRKTLARWCIVPTRSGVTADVLTGLCVCLTGICQQKKKRDQNALPLPLLTHCSVAIIRACASIVAQKRAQAGGENFSSLASKEKEGTRWHLPFWAGFASPGDRRERLKICKKRGMALKSRGWAWGNFSRGTCPLFL